MFCSQLLQEAMREVNCRPITKHVPNHSTNRHAHTSITTAYTTTTYTAGCRITCCIDARSHHCRQREVPEGPTITNGSTNGWSDNTQCGVAITHTRCSNEEASEVNRWRQSNTSGTNTTTTSISATIGTCRASMPAALVPYSDYETAHGTARQSKGSVAVGIGAQGGP